MSDNAVVAEGYDVRWHSEMDRKVKSLMEDVKGNGQKGLKERMNIIESYVETRIEREEELDKERRANRIQYRIAAFGGTLALMGLLVMAVLDHTILKPPAPQVMQVQTSTSTVTDTTSTTKVQPKGR